MKHKSKNYKKIIFSIIMTMCTTPLLATDKIAIEDFTAWNRIPMPADMTDLLNDYDDKVVKISTSNKFQKDGQNVHTFNLETGVKDVLHTMLAADRFIYNDQIDIFKVYEEVLFMVPNHDVTTPEGQQFTIELLAESLDKLFDHFERDRVETKELKVDMVMLTIRTWQLACALDRAGSDIAEDTKNAYQANPAYQAYRAEQKALDELEQLLRTLEGDDQEVLASIQQAIDEQKVKVADAESLLPARNEPDVITSRELFINSIYENLATGGGCFPGFSGRMAQLYIRLMRDTYWEN